MPLSLLAMISANGSADAVDKFRLALEASSASWFNLVKWAGYAVAIGCALEAPETFILIKRWWFLRFRDIDHEETKEDRKSWPVPLAAVGLIVIVLGIVLETFGESKVSDVDALLRAHESDKISAAESDAGTAKDAAKAASTDAIVAKGNAESAGKIAAHAIAGQAALEQENAALRAKMAPRRVTGEQAKILCSGLHANGLRTLEIGASMGTTEPNDFADDIGRAIVACQVELSVMFHPSVLITPVPAPFRIAYAPARKQDAEMISAAMITAKIATKPIELIPAPDEDQHPDALRLFVGPKLP